MDGYCMSKQEIDEFETYLHSEEREPATIEKYLRDLRCFARWLQGAPVTKTAVTGWKEHLAERGYAPATINSMLAALNKFFVFRNRPDCRVRYLRLQRRMFRSEARELDKEEYRRLIDAAGRQGKRRLALLIETICATGIRVSEVRYITMEAASKGIAEISLKGKIRTILLPNKLCRKLLKYAKKQKIASGEIFLTRGGNSISRKQIWAEMKALCTAAKVSPTKVFPHNLRHLFAQRFYKTCRDIVKLADVLGHSSVETTRIYLISTGKEHTKIIEGLRLVL